MLVCFVGPERGPRTRPTKAAKNQDPININPLCVLPAVALLGSKLLHFGDQLWYQSWGRILVPLLGPPFSGTYTSGLFQGSLSRPQNRTQNRTKANSNVGPNPGPRAPLTVYVLREREITIFWGAISGPSRGPGNKMVLPLVFVPRMGRRKVRAPPFNHIVLGFLSDLSPFSYPF